MPGWSTYALDDLVDELTEVLFSGDPSPERLEPWPEARAGLVGALYYPRRPRGGPPLPPTSHRSLSSAWPSTPRSAQWTSRRAHHGKPGARLRDHDRQAQGCSPSTGSRPRALLAPVGRWAMTVRSDSTQTEAGLRKKQSPLRAAEPFGVALCEEPTGGIDAIAAVGEAVAVPVAADESMRSLEDLDAVLAAGSIGFVVIKPQAFGGPDLAMAAIERARGAGVTPIVTSMIDSAIGVAHAVHVAAAVGSTSPTDWPRRRCSPPTSGRPSRWSMVGSTCPTGPVSVCVRPNRPGSVPGRGSLHHSARPSRASDRWRRRGRRSRTVRDRTSASCRDCGVPAGSRHSPCGVINHASGPSRRRCRPQRCWVPR